MAKATNKATDSPEFKAFDVEAAKGALRTIHKATWLVEAHASLIRAVDQGTLPDGVCDETLAWHCPAECERQAGRIMSALERLHKALGIDEALFGNGAKCDDDPSLGAGNG